jgi:hypothetical protein
MGREIESRQGIGWQFFNVVKFGKVWFGILWGDFFTKASGHPVFLI